MSQYTHPLGTGLSADQTIVRAYDEAENRHRVDAKVTAVIGEVDVVIDAASGDNIAIQDAEGDQLGVNADGSINVIVQDITLDHTNDSVEVFQDTHDNLNANANVQQNNTDVSAANPLYTQTTNGNLETTQAQILTELQSANSSLDAIESDADAIRLQAVDINAELDTQTGILTNIKTDTAQIITELQASNTSLDNIESDADAIRIAVQSIDTDFDVALSTRATEATQLDNKAELQAINSELDSQTVLLTNIDQSTNDIETAVESIDTKFDVNLSTRNAETTQLQVLSELQTANTSLDNIEADADAIRIATQSIDTDFDVALSTRATEATQLLNLTELQAVNAELDLQTALLTTINDSANDIEARLESFDTDAGATTSNTLRTSSNITDEAGVAFTDTNYLPVGQTTHDNLNLNANLQVGNTDVSTANPVPNSSVDNGLMIIDDTSPLIGSAVFTSDWFDTLNYGDIVVSAFSDVAGGYFELDWSRDLAGTNPRPDGDQYFLSASVLKGNVYGPKHRYFRIRFVNGITPMGVFELQVTLKKIHTKPSSHKINEPINDDADGELVKSVGTAKNPDEDYINIRVQGAHTPNSTSIPLAANDTYRGEWFNWQQNYIGMAIDLSSDVSGTLYVDLSQQDNPVDGSDVSLDDSVPFPYIYSVAEPILKVKVPIQSKWVRVRYINGNAGQTIFLLDTAFVTSDPGLTQGPVSRMPTSKNISGLVRSIPTLPDNSGGYKEVPMSLLGNPKVSLDEIHDDISVEPLDTAVFTQLVVGTSATRIDSDTPANRRAVRVRNEGPGRVAVGTDPSLTFSSQSNRIGVGMSDAFLLAPSVNLYAIAETTSGSQTTLQRSPASASGTATNPNNVISNNASYANFTAAAETITATGYTAGTANTLVSVKIGLDGNKQASQTETATVSEFQSGATAGSGTVVSASLSGGLNQLYIAVITRNAASGTVNTVTGGGVTFTATSQVNIASGNRRIDVWSAYGTFTSGAVTATLSTSTNAHIAVYRITNADPTTPIQTINNTTGSGTAVTGPGIAGTNKGLAILAISHRDTSGTPGAGYTENVDLTNGSGSNIDSLIAANKSLVSTGTETGTYTLATSADWAAIGITVTPAPAVDPRITLSYTLSAVPGATSGVVTLTSSSDVSTTVDITPDRSWVVADIANVNVVATATTLSAAQANIDWLYIELIDTTGNIARLSIFQGGKTVI